MINFVKIKLRRYAHLSYALNILKPESSFSPCRHCGRAFFFCLFAHSLIPPYLTIVSSFLMRFSVISLTSVQRLAQQLKHVGIPDDPVAMMPCIGVCKCYGLAVSLTFICQHPVRILEDGAF